MTASQKKLEADEKNRLNDEAAIVKFAGLSAIYISQNSDLQWTLICTCLTPTTEILILGCLGRFTCGLCAE